MKNTASSVLLSDALVVRLPVGAGLSSAPSAETTLSFLRVARAKVVQRGRATLADLPRARTTVLVLPAEDVLLLERDVPPLNERRLRAALPALIEDATFADIASLHVVAGPSRGVSRLLAVIDRALLKRWLEFFESDGRVVAHAWCEALCVPYRLGGWTLALRGDGKSPQAMLRSGASQILTLTGAASDEVLVSLAAQRMAPEGEVMLYGDKEALGGYQALLSRLQLPMRRAGTDGVAEFLEGEHPAPLDLLQGEFDRGLSLASVRAWQTVAALVLIALLIETVGLAWHASQLDANKNRLVTDQASILKRAFPETTTILDAPTQMRRALDTLQQRSGKTSAAGFEAELAHAGTLLAGLPPDACSEMHFDNDALLMHLKAPTLAQSSTQSLIIKSAQALGSVATFTAASADGDLTFRLAPRSLP